MCMCVCVCVCVCVYMCETVSVGSMGGYVCEGVTYTYKMHASDKSWVWRTGKEVTPTVHFTCGFIRYS